MAFTGHRPHTKQVVVVMTAAILRHRPVCPPRAHGAAHAGVVAGSGLWKGTGGGGGGRAATPRTVRVALGAPARVGGAGAEVT